MLRIFQGTANSRIFNKLEQFLNEFYAELDRISVRLSQKKMAQVMKFTFTKLKRQYKHKYDRCCKLTTRKIIQKKMSLSLHNLLVGFDQFFSSARAQI